MYKYFVFKDGGLSFQAFLCANEGWLSWKNSMSVGIVSNTWPPTRGPASLLMADVRCLPGEPFLNAVYMSAYPEILKLVL